MQVAAEGPLRELLRCRLRLAAEATSPDQPTDHELREKGPGGGAIGEQIRTFREKGRRERRTGGEGFESQGGARGKAKAAEGRGGKNGIRRN